MSLIQFFFFLLTIKFTYAGECSDDLNEGYVCCACVCCVVCNLESAHFDDCSYQSDSGGNAPLAPSGGAPGQYVTATYQLHKFNYIYGTPSSLSTTTCSDEHRLENYDHCSWQSPCDEPTCQGYCVMEDDCNYYRYTPSSGQCILYEDCDETRQSDWGMTAVKVIEYREQNMAEIKCTLIAHDVITRVYYNEQQLKLTKDHEGYYSFGYYAVYDASLAISAEVRATRTPAAIQMACSDGFTTHRDWYGYSANPGSNPPKVSGNEWYFNKYDVTKKMSKVKKDYDGKNFYVYGTFPEQLSLSSESIWPKEGKQWAWFNIQPYRAHYTHGRRVLVTDPTIAARRRYLEDMTPVSTTINGTDYNDHGVEIPHLLGVNETMYKVRSRWTMYDNEGNVTLTYKNTIPNLIFEQYVGCHTLEEFLVIYEAKCKTQLCIYKANEVDATMRKKGVEQICVELSDWSGLEITLHDNIDLLVEEGNDSGTVAESKYVAVVVVVAILAACLVCSWGYFYYAASNSDSEKENHWTKL